MSDEKEYIPAIPENLEFPLQEISKILNQIDNLCSDVNAIEKYLAGKWGLSRKMIRQCAIEFHTRDFTTMLTELQLLHREQELARNPASIINPPQGAI
jgi:hypothetical protein